MNRFTQGGGTIRSAFENIALAAVWRIQTPRQQATATAQGCEGGVLGLDS